MHLLFALAILIALAGYVGLVPAAAGISDVPITLVIGSIVTLGVLYVFARS